MSEFSGTYAARPHSINDTRLFAALTAMGVAPIEGPRLYTGETTDGSPRQTWYLERESRCGKYTTAELIAAWNDAQWHEAHPEHPFAYIKCAFMNHAAAVDHIKQQCGLYVVRGRGGKFGLVSSDLDKKSTDAILRTLGR